MRKTSPLALFHSCALFLTVVAVSVSILPAQDSRMAPDVASANADRAVLLSGIDILPLPGSPGTVSVFGPDAFAVLTGGGSQPLAMIGAARFGRGRVVLAAHGYHGAANSALNPNDGLSVFAHNALGWITDGKAKPIVGKLNLPISEWRKHDVLIWSGAPEWPDQDWIEALQGYVRRGGGLFMGSCPWGWAQLSGKDIREEHPMNQVAAVMGLVLADGYCNANQDGGYSVSKTQAQHVHAGRVLDFYQSRAQEAVSDDAPSYHPLLHAVDSIPNQDEILLPNLLQFAEQMGGQHAPSPAKPLKEIDGAARFWVALQSRLWKDLPVSERVAFPGADGFPGAVPASARQVRGNLIASAERPGWQSTGLYLAPGAVLRVAKIKCETKADSDGIIKGWSIRIGCHRDQLWHKATWPRWPEITQELPIQADLEMCTPWGGPIYLVASPEAMPIEVTLKGAVEAPLFVLGETTLKEWAKNKKAPGPWAEIVGRECVLTVPSRAVRDLQDPTDAITFWDGVITSHCDLGAEEVPKRKERFVPDVLISAGYMHSGYPVMTHLDVAEPRGGNLARVLDVERLKKEGSWGHFHEWGHNRQKGAWTFSGTGEVTCNLFSLHAGEVMSGIEPWANPWLQGQKKAAIDYLKELKFEEWKSNPGIALVVYAMLQREFTWEAYKRVFELYHELQPSQLPKNDEEKRNQFIIYFSQTVGRDLRPLFLRWGWPDSESLASHYELSRLSPYEGDFQWAGYAAPSGRPLEHSWLETATKQHQSTRLVEPQAVNESIQRGVDFLLSTQLVDGSWSDYKSSYPNGQTALSVYTLLKCGIPSTHLAIRRGLSYLKQNSPIRTYSLGVQMMAVEAAHEDSLLPWMEELQEQLLGWQRTDGMWSYPTDPTSDPDLSITQYAALGLRSAHLMGLKPSRKAWQKLARGFLAYQEQSKGSGPLQATAGGGLAEPRGFGYRKGSSSTGSMTAAGVAVAIVCEEALGKRLRGSEKQSIRLAREAGISWMSNHFAVDHNPGFQSNRHLYYLYGLERVCNLLDMPKFAEHDWYQEGAAWLLENQLSAGQWAGSCETQTCFALLFLNRATLESVTGEQASSVVTLNKTTASDSGAIMHLVRGDPLILWMDLDGQSAEKVTYWARPRQTGDAVLLQSVVASDDARFAAKVVCPPGDWFIYAEVETFVGGVEKTGELEFRNEWVHASFSLIDSIAKKKNRLALAGPRAMASGFSSGHEANNAVDGRFDTYWAAPAGEKQPRFELKLKKAVSARQIVFSHARTKRADSYPNQNPRITKINLWLGKSRKPIVIDINPNAQEETVFPLSGKKKIQSLRFEVLASTDDSANIGLGFSEIELR